MPTYEYECLDCQRHLEVFQKINDTPISFCPYCKGRLKKLISTGCGLIFKGSGFYVTDYKKKPESSPPKEGVDRKETSSDKNQEGEKKKDSQ